MSAGGTLTQLISTGVQDAYLETSIPKIPCVSTNLTSPSTQSQTGHCQADSGNMRDNICPIENYL